MASNTRAAPRTYVSGGQMLDAPPLTVRVRTAVGDAYNFFGLYVTTFFALDPYTAAANSQFATTNRATPTAPSRGSGGSGRTWGSGGGGGGGGGRRLGGMSDVRGGNDIQAPVCTSCR